jgi:hypothetical protein
MRGATPSFLQPKPVAKKRAAVNTAYAREKAMKFKMNGFKRVLSVGGLAPATTTLALGAP